MTGNSPDLEIGTACRPVRDALIAVRGIRTPASHPHTHPYLPLGVGAVSGARPLRSPLQSSTPLSWWAERALMIGLGSADAVELIVSGWVTCADVQSAAMKRASSTDTTASSPRAVCRTVLTIASLLYVSTL